MSEMIHQDSKKSFQEFLLLHNEQLCSPTQEINFSSIKQFAAKKQKEESEPSFRIMDGTEDKNLQSMQSKIQLLITENSKLIEINSGLMREIEIMKQNNQSNRNLMAQESQQKIMNYQQKVVQLTQANEQLSARLIDEQSKNKKDIDYKVSQVLQENQNLNVLLQSRLNDIEILNNQIIERNNQIDLISEQIKMISEKCQVLEQQKQVLIAQQTQYIDTLKEMEQKEKSFYQQLNQEQSQYQTCVQNLEQNYNLQINELRNSFLKEIEQQQQNLIQQYQQHYTQQNHQFQLQFKQLQTENVQIKQELNERSKIWNQEKERLEIIIKQFQEIKQQQQQSINKEQFEQTIKPSPKNIVYQQPQEKKKETEDAIQSQEDVEKQQFYEEIHQIQQKHHQSSNYTFRQNTQEDSRELSLDEEFNFKQTEQHKRLNTENFNDKYDRTIYNNRVPLVQKNYRVPQLNTLTRHDLKPQYSVNSIAYYQQQPKIIVNRDPNYQRSISSYQERDEKLKTLQFNREGSQGYLLPRRY